MQCEAPSTQCVFAEPAEQVCDDHLCAVLHSREELLLTRERLLGSDELSGAIGAPSWRTATRTELRCLDRQSVRAAPRSVPRAAPHDAAPRVAGGWRCVGDAACKPASLSRSSSRSTIELNDDDEDNSIEASESTAPSSAGGDEADGYATSLDPRAAEFCPAGLGSAPAFNAKAAEFVPRATASEFVPWAHAPEYLPWGAPRAVPSCGIRAGIHGPKDFTPMKVVAGCAPGLGATKERPQGKITVKELQRRLAESHSLSSGTAMVA